MIPQPYEPLNGGFCLRIWLTPQARQEKCAGIFIDADGQAYIKAYVRVVPENNKANKALIRLIANKLGIPPSAIAIISGQGARRKKLAIHRGGDQVRIALEALIHCCSDSVGSK